MTDKKITLIFPGQGSQYVGMGKEFYEEYQFVRDLYDRASQVLGYDIADKCFRKPAFGRKLMHREDLNKTIFTQPAVLVTSYACLKVLQEKCKEADVKLKFSLLAGHSLGEYTALLVAGSIDFETAVRLVHKRATYITDFSKAYPDAGLMAIVDKKKGFDQETIDDMCKSFQVYVTLINTRNQIVVGGFRRNLSELSRKLKKDGKMATVLRVEGPFHSPLMKPAAERFKMDLDQVDIFIADKPIIANVTTEAIVDPNHIRTELYAQIYTLVDWKLTIEKIVENGGDLFIEVGPKKVLTNLVKAIVPSVKRYNVEDVKSLEETIKGLKNSTGAEAELMDKTDVLDSETSGMED